MNVKTVRFGQLLLYAALSLVDLALTNRLLERADGHVYESNPIANAWLSAYGWTGLAAFKLTCVGLVIIVAVVLWIRRPRLGDHLLTFSCTVVALVVLYSCSLVGFFQGLPMPMSFRASTESPVSGVETNPRPQIAHEKGFFKKSGAPVRFKQPPVPGRVATVASL
jgi:Domain of unknown function (DUF5658)